MRPKISVNTINAAFNKLLDNRTLLLDATASGNLRVLISLLGPAYRGLIQQRGKSESATDIKLNSPAHFDWHYKREHPEMKRLTEIAKISQWNATTDIDWLQEVDFFDPSKPLLIEEFHPASTLPIWSKLTFEERAAQIRLLLSWLLSQFLHGEQGALFAAAQTTQSVPWLDAKLYGSTQVVDEGRHVEVFHTYLTKKLEKLYEINDNLYVVIDALMSDSRWDVKFLGMQIMIEGLALGAFGTIRQISGEPLLKELLRYVITDEARHVHYGVLALQQFYTTELSEKERRNREDWAFEMSLLLRNRFLMHELYDEFYAHHLSRAAWDKLVLKSKMMNSFRKTMFKRIIPNLKRIGLLSNRIRSHYEKIGLLAFENSKAAPELSVTELLDN
ncbi:MAG: ferritin-like domain-containing protein [Blastocatellia bacterium]|nr:ferritin-like domain-containing protein [Blastocatellia bacterium]